MNSAGRAGALRLLALLVLSTCSIAGANRSALRSPELQLLQREWPAAAPAAVLQAPLPPHSTACALAGGWCPLDSWPLQPQRGPQLDAPDGAAWVPDSAGRVSSALNASLQAAAASSLLQRTISTATTADGSAEGDGEEKADDEPLPHKALLPLAPWDVLGVALASLALLLAASGGIGGGAILVPINLMILGFSTGSAVALSNITIVGGTLANLAFNVNRRHPLRQGPLIDWDLILVMEPSTILGALVGGYLNKILPGWLTTVSLSLLLGLITYKTLNKGRDIYAREQANLAAGLTPLPFTDSADALEALGSSAVAEGDGSGGQARGSNGQLHSRQAPSPEGPLGLGPDSAATSHGSAADGQLAAQADTNASRSLTTAGAAAPAVAPPPTPAIQAGLPASAAVASPAAAAIDLDLEAAAAAGVDEVQPLLSSSAGRRPSSYPLPIGGDGGGADLALPLLSPIEQPQETSLEGGGERRVHGTGGGLRITPLGGKWPMAGKDLGSPFADKPAGGRSGDGGVLSGAGSKPRAACHPYLPLGKVSVLLLLLAGVVATDILKGRTACPSLDYWLAATAMVPVTVAVLFAIRLYLLRKGANNRAAGYELLEGDVEWNSRATLLYPALCSFAGLAAGIFGVGGGIIKGPLMLEMGVLPEVAAATSATMIFFTSASASVVFISFGAVQWDYAAVLFAMGLVCTAIGQLLVMWVNRHIRSRSLLVFVMAAVLGISSLALAVQGVQSTAAAAAAHDLWHFHGICGNRSA